MNVASVPARHVYARHLGVPGDGVHRIATPDHLYSASAMMSAAWVDAHATQFSCFHTHFGFGEVGTDQLVRWRQALRRHDRPLVHTVHDIWNPHVADQHHHLDQVGFLVREADGLVTLTDRAADEVERRWGRRPLVIPHPPVLALSRPPRRRCDPLRVGLHLKDGRPSLHGRSLVRGLVDRLAGHPGIALEVRAYPSLRARRPALAAALHEVADRPSVEVRWEGFTSDDGFARDIRSLDVALLGYRVGTHSGWAEACLDVGTRVIAPAHTCIPDQDPSIVAVAMEDDVDVDAVVTHLAAWVGRPRPVVDQVGRARRRRDVAAAHARLYRALVHG